MIDTYIITAEYADYDQPASGTDYVQRVGLRYVSTRYQAATLALEWLRNTPVMSRGETDVPASYVIIEGQESERPRMRLTVRPEFTGDAKELAAAIERAEMTGDLYRAAVPAWRSMR